jgi:hypothetical protein
VQFSHCEPEKPHCWSTVPARQVLPWQHPAQLPGPHVVGGTHPPLLHDSLLGAQSWHDAPPRPHAFADVPSRHVSPTQHPLQFCGPHDGVSVHCWFEHTSPEPAQFWHCDPAKPHALDDVPAWQALPTQHPGQFAGPHVGWPRHWPLTHVSPSGTQSWHVEPP